MIVFDIWKCLDYLPLPRIPQTSGITTGVEVEHNNDSSDVADPFDHVFKSEVGYFCLD